MPDLFCFSVIKTLKCYNTEAVKAVKISECLTINYEK